MFSVTDHAANNCVLSVVLSVARCALNCFLTESLNCARTFLDVRYQRVVARLVYVYAETQGLLE